MTTTLWRPEDDGDGDDHHRPMTNSAAGGRPCGLVPDGLDVTEWGEPGTDAEIARTATIASTWLESDRTVGDVAHTVAVPGGLVVVDVTARRWAGYPRAGIEPGSIFDRRARAFSLSHTRPPLVGEHWALVEIVPAVPADPWGDRAEHQVGEVLAVTSTRLEHVTRWRA